MEKLNDDILTNILLQLPARPLIQLKMVCKRWHALISSPHFAKFHLKQSLRDDGASCHCILKTNPMQCISYELFENGGAGKVIWDLDDPFGHLEEEPRVVASFDGLVCLVYFVNDHDVVMLCNPLTRELRKLPRPDFHPSGTMARYIYGLGYDGESDDYKLLRFVSFQVDGGALESVTEIFTLKSNAWKRIHDRPKGIFQKFSCETAYLNGAVHWLGKLEPRSDSDTVVSFDLNQEKFMDVVPIPKVDQSIGFMGTGIFDGCLMLYPMFWEDGSAPWVMKEYGVGTSWSKFFKVPVKKLPVSTTLLLICFRNDKVLFDCDCAQMVLYDVKKKTRKVLPISIRTGTDFSCAVYVESLISPYPGKSTTSDYALKGRLRLEWCT